jgi:hypothetical protein
MKKASWERLLEEQRCSGLTIAAYFLERGINRKTRSFHKSTLKRGEFIKVVEKPKAEPVLPKGIVLRVSLGDLKGVFMVLDG